MLRQGNEQVSLAIARSNMVEISAAQAIISAAQESLDSILGSGPPAAKKRK
jgi:hypothetical protein